MLTLENVPTLYHRQLLVCRTTGVHTVRCSRLLSFLLLATVVVTPFLSRGHILKVSGLGASIALQVLRWMRWMRWWATVLFAVVAKIAS
jgi:hypothetical protein